VFVGSHQLEALGAHARSEVVVQRRRLVDRFGLFVCESICRDASVPEWVRRGLPVMPEIMTVSDRLSDASCEHAPMPPMRQRMGETRHFVLRIVDVIPNGALVQISDPLILARVMGVPPEPRLRSGSLRPMLPGEACGSRW
jgi:hypothetical protein